MKSKTFLFLVAALLLTACDDNSSIVPSTLPSSGSELTSTSETISSSTSEATSEEPSEKPSESTSEKPSEESSEKPSETSSEKPSSSSSESSSESKKPSYDIPTTPLTGYYKTVDINNRGAALLSDVKEVIFKPHDLYTSYGECRGQDASGGKYHKTDYDPKKPSNLIMLYTRASINASWSSGQTYNREHVWPQSLSNGLWGTSGGGSDLHHIRPSFNKVNGRRGNCQFGDNGKKGLYRHSYNGKTYDAGYVSGNTWEPLDEAKGDVARIILYTFVHYNNVRGLESNDGIPGAITADVGTKYSQYTGNLPITNVMEGSVSSAFALLSKWNKLDPVDETEINRNEAVYKIQGNRNAFIDHPWLVDAIWG